MPWKGRDVPERLCSIKKKMSYTVKCVLSNRYLYSIISSKIMVGAPVLVYGAPYAAYIF